MNVSTVVIPKEVAEEKLQEYRTVIKENRRVEDADFRRMYKAAQSGHAIIDVSNAFRETGLNEKGHPKLAMARADWKLCHFLRNQRIFAANSQWRPLKADTYKIPNDAWNWDKATFNNLVTNVPYIPPAIRPKDDLVNYHILFEVQKWEEYPADPFLLKHITGFLYSVIAEWELTDLERGLLKGRL